MGDRTNPIKFGPEWLRNLPGSPGSGGGGVAGGGRLPSTHPPLTSPFTHGGGAHHSTASASTSPNANATSAHTNTSKVLLAKLRYGREEMLALYDRETVEPPELLKVIDLLYQPRGKPPYALNNSFEDENRESSRSSSGMGVGGGGGGTGGGERFVGGRGKGVVTDTRIRPSLPSHRGSRPLFRQPSVGARTSGWHVSHPRLPFGSGGVADDELNPHGRSWNNSNINNTAIRNVADQTDWNNKMTYRSKRSNTTNWRQQQGRDEGDEWRSSEAARRNTTLEKWGEREWGEREKPWNNNRRTWLGGDSEDALPEWAVENAEACGGTFDSTGAFHGYSNDDTNLPRNQDASYPLVRSQTHGAFSRSKTAEEGSDEWWASEKAKKLSPKRFIPDANTTDNNKYRRRIPKGVISEELVSRGNVGEGGGGGGPNSTMTVSGRAEEEEGEVEAARADRDEESGNFHSVMLASNNALRQKHQSIGAPPPPPPPPTRTETPATDTHTSAAPSDLAASTLHTTINTHKMHSEEEKRKDKETNKLVEDILDMNLEEELGGVLGGRGRGRVTSAGIGVSPPVGVTNDVLNASLGLPLSGSALSGSALSGAFSSRPDAHMYPMHPRHFNYPPPVQPPTPHADPDPADHWYYEDPKQMIQGPFSSKEMCSWYKAGFFGPSLMVRRACEPVMRPLATYGPLPFGPLDLLPSFSAYELHRPQPDPLLPHLPRHHHHHPPHSSLSLNVESLWSSGGGGGGGDLMWLQRSTSLAPAPPAPASAAAPSTSASAPVTDRINNLPMYFWDHQQSPLTSNARLPEEIAKEMKTEEQILAQLRASQIASGSPPLPSSLLAPDDSPPIPLPPTLLAQTQQHAAAAAAAAVASASLPAHTHTYPEQKKEENVKSGESMGTINSSSSDTATTTIAAAAAALSALTEKMNKRQVAEEAIPPSQSQPPTITDKNKNNKTKNKKCKDDKKDDNVEIKHDHFHNFEKRSQEPSPTKNKKEEKVNKKDIEKEKKEWIKEGFTIVKGAEKNKEKKKQQQQTASPVTPADEASQPDDRRKDEDKIAIEEDKKKQQQDNNKKQQLQGNVMTSTSASGMRAVVGGGGGMGMRRAPWSGAAAALSGPAAVPLADIQRLERESRAAAAAALAAAAAVAATTAPPPLHRPPPSLSPLGTWMPAPPQLHQDPYALANAAAPPTLGSPWPMPANGGFWDSPANRALAGAAGMSATIGKNEPEHQGVRRKPMSAVGGGVPVSLAPAPPASTSTSTSSSTRAAAEFDAWCNTTLSAWRDTNIDVPTFVSFLKDIESPFEVKEYVKCYLGEGRDASDFARQFIEKRSGNASGTSGGACGAGGDDLCAPAAALTPTPPRQPRKHKKNKMVKLDARILGFSVTAAEDRINVGDIDTV